MKILIVDDEPIVLESLERLLMNLGPDGWEIVGASSGASALDVMASTTVDLLITDMRMPGMNGVDLLNTTATRWPQVARFALSAEMNELQAIRAAGIAHQFLGKPCRAEALLAAIYSVESLSRGAEAAAVKAIVSAVPRLPALPSVFVELRRMFADPRSDSRKVAEVIRRDPGITAKVMQLANSSFFFRGSAIADVHAAVSRLGAALIARLVLAEGLLATTPPVDRFGYADDVRRFFRAALVAEAAVSPAVRDEASLAVLLCPIGRIVMIAADPERVDEVMSIADADGITLMAAERRVFGACHAAVGGHLVSLWGLPPAVTTAVAAQHSPTSHRPGDDVSAATFLANRDVRAIPLDVGFLAAPGAGALVTAWDRHATRLGEHS